MLSRSSAVPWPVRAEMIDALQFKNFRGFKDVKIEPLKRVNLLIGGNDNGKTSVLEALYLLLANSFTQLEDFPFILRNNQTGGQKGNFYDDFTNFWRWVFHDTDYRHSVEITARVDER